MSNKKTKVECYLTGCKYNTACCISAAKSEKKHYCTKENICIDIIENDEDSAEFTCTSYEIGRKPKECIKCAQENNDGMVPLFDDDIFEIEEVEISSDDDDFLL